MLVKFSPPVREEAGRRVADLLVCEHLALSLLRECGVDAAHSHIVTSGQRLFLEVERFDRVSASLGRKGVVSLDALVAHHTRQGTHWTDMTQILCAAGHVPKSCVAEVRTRELFGDLIANTDMHAGNLAFFCRHLATATSLAPVYDMLPMRYALRGGDVSWPPFEPHIPPHLASEAARVLPWATTYWHRVAHDERISARFRNTAQENMRAIIRLQSLWANGT